MAKTKKAATVWVFMDRSFTLPIDQVSSRTFPAGGGYFVSAAEAKAIVAAEAGRIEEPPSRAAEAETEESGA